MSEAEVTAEKARWRERFRAARRALPAHTLTAASDRIVARLSDMLGPSGAAALFWPLPGEIDLRLLAEMLHRRGVVVALPVVVGDRQIEWRRFHSADALVPRRWGLREPAPNAPVIAPDTLTTVIVPGLAFGRDGSRLGYGGGFYDTALAQTQAVRWGVVVDGALVDAVPSEPHDVRMDAIVTDREVCQVRRA